jgi:hypothetical protein
MLNPAQFCSLAEDVNKITSQLSHSILQKQFLFFKIINKYVFRVREGEILSSHIDNYGNCCLQRCNAV